MCGCLFYHYAIGGYQFSRIDQNAIAHLKTSNRDNVAPARAEGVEMYLRLSSSVEKDMDVIAIRLKPGEDLRQSLLGYCIDRKIDAAFMLSCVGSLRQATIRFANRPEGTGFEQPLEIVSLEGTLSQYGAHLHVVVSDSEGHVIGGHLMDGSHIRTTAEIVLGIVPNAMFKREFDPLTGYRELTITR